MHISVGTFRKSGNGPMGCVISFVRKMLKKPVLNSFGANSTAFTLILYYSAHCHRITINAWSGICCEEFVHSWNWTSVYQSLLTR